MINEKIINTMVEMADAAREQAYCPYSKKAVGVCLLASDGTLYSGCNIENASYSLSICAERVAIYRAIADHKREFDAIAVISDAPEPCVPCGACCQVLAEFNIRDVIMANTAGEIQVADLMDIAPYAMAKKGR